MNTTTVLNTDDIAETMATNCRRPSLLWIDAWSLPSWKKAVPSSRARNTALTKRPLRDTRSRTTCLHALWLSISSCSHRDASAWTDDIVLFPSVLVLSLSFLPSLGGGERALPDMDPYRLPLTAGAPSFTSLCFFSPLSMSFWASDSLHLAKRFCTRSSEERRDSSLSKLTLAASTQKSPGLKAGGMGRPTDSKYGPTELESPEKTVCP
mmetsp:Transcript_24732/g.48509  ORF Transcript_24732/g.48509 Transcript_24732/m.48509 type:complete len:209 (-) Transcript_24732:996-1622(-)